MAADRHTADTIVLIRSFWVTRSWEHWKTYYEGKGYTVLTPGYPGVDVRSTARSGPERRQHRPVTGEV